MDPGVPRRLLPSLLAGVQGRPLPRCGWGKGLSLTRDTDQWERWHCAHARLRAAFLASSPHCTSHGVPATWHWAWGPPVSPSAAPQAQVCPGPTRACEQLHDPLCRRELVSAEMGSALGSLPGPCW